jgi:DNA-binding CsgD family transcriptional regulator
MLDYARAGCDILCGCPQGARLLGWLRFCSPMLRVRPVGETMTTAAMATYAYDEIDQARTELETYAQRGRGERNRPTSGWASLTPTERDVVRLVSEGLANKDIAKRLFVSPRTVQTHLTHVYTKLGITSRVQLAQEAAHHA